jgi:hypothetical protein
VPACLTIEHIGKNHIRKEDVVARVLVVHGDRPGLVHVISAMEACDTYKPWHDKHTHRTFLRPDTGKCLHYNFYVIDAELGLIYLRVPTWCPFRLRFYCNGHSWVARQLTAAGVAFTLADNAFLRIDDWERAQSLADTLSPDHLHRILDRYAQQCCPVLDVFAQSYHWSFMQVEYATDLAFRTPAILKPLYEQLSRQAILTVKAEHFAIFLGRRITAQLAQEIGSQFTTQTEGTCVKHQRPKPLGPQLFSSRAEQTPLAAFQRPGFNIAGFAVPTYCCPSANPLQPPYPENSPVCAISASSNASSIPIAIAHARWPRRHRCRPPLH